MPCLDWCEKSPANCIKRLWNDDGFRFRDRQEFRVALAFEAVRKSTLDFQVEVHVRRIELMDGP